MDSQAEVRCPLCDAEYPLSEALALTPPELIPVLSAVRQESALTPGRSEALAAVDRGEASEPVATIPFGGAVESAETLARGGNGRGGGRGERSGGGGRQVPAATSRFTYAGERHHR